MHDETYTPEIPKQNINNLPLIFLNKNALRVV